MNVFPTDFDTDLVASVITAVGDNVTALLVVAGLAIGIPLAFYVLRRVKAMF